MGHGAFLPSLIVLEVPLIGPVAQGGYGRSAGIARPDDYQHLLRAAARFAGAESDAYRLFTAADGGLLAGGAPSGRTAIAMSSVPDSVPSETVRRRT